MSARLKERLYQALDRVVSFNALSNRDIPAVTLTSADFDIFKKYNTKSNDGYHYRGLTIRSK